MSHRQKEEGSATVRRVEWMGGREWIRLREKRMSEVDCSVAGNLWKGGRDRKREGLWDGCEIPARSPCLVLCKKSLPVTTEPSKTRNDVE